ncbi:MAG: hypothetical protein QXD72_00185 [Candidatus Aenigmatarchaeota archaeon]
MSPIHTHDSTGKLHIENLNPSAKPETLTILMMSGVRDLIVNVFLIIVTVV